jgi:hypothetical protein
VSGNGLAFNAQVAVEKPFPSPSTLTNALAGASQSISGSARACRHLYIRRIHVAATSGSSAVRCNGARTDALNDE